MLIFFVKISDFQRKKNRPTFLPTPIFCSFLANYKAQILTLSNKEFFDWHY